MREDLVTVKGRRLHFREAGEGRPVVLVHGNTGSSRWFVRIEEIPGVRFIAPDLPNFGESDGIGAVEIDEYAAYLLAFLDALSIRTATVVGHSLGGAVAMSLALSNPQRVTRLLLIDSAPIAGLVTPEEHYPAIEQYRANRQLLAQALRFVVPHLSDERFFEELVDDAQRMHPDAFVGNARALARYDYTKEAGRFDRPVLFIVGAEDVLVTEAMAQETARSFPLGRSRTLPGVGHSVIVEDPRLFREILADFLAE